MEEMVPSSTLEAGVAKVNLTTDLRNIIHQINPNDLLCAYKPTFEKWATRTLQDLDPGFRLWEGKEESAPLPDNTDTKGIGHIKIGRRIDLCSQDAASDKSAVLGWDVCSSRHNGASAVYQRELHGLRLSRDRRSQSSSSVEKPPECRRLISQEKNRFKLGLHLTRKSVQDVRLRDCGEERGPIPAIQNSLSRPCSPKQVSFKHWEGYKQHMDHYRESYTYKKIQLHKNQYVRRAIACGLALQNYPLRGFSDIPCAHCPSYVRSAVPKDHGLMTTSQSNCLLKTSTRSPQLQADVLVTERRRNLVFHNASRTATPVPRKDRLIPPVSQCLVGLNNGMMNMDMYQEPLAQFPAGSKESNKVMLDVPLIVCRAHPSIPKNLQPEKMYHLTEPNVSVVGSDVTTPQKK